MPVFGEGEFFFEVRNLYGGIRQDLHELSDRYTCIKNMHHARLRALTKNTGYRVLNTTSAIGGTPRFDAGLDVKFNSGTQKTYVLAGTDAYIFNASTLEFDAQSQSLTQNDNADIQLHANNVYIINGTQFKYHDGSSWSDVGGSPPIGTMMATHNNRLIVSGRSAAPYEFYYSDIRGNTFDVSNDKVIAGGTSGEAITSIHEIGDYLFVGTRLGMWLYEQSASSPKQWDPINLSENIGPINDRATFLVSRRGLKILLFWTDDGPACAYVRGREAGWKPLWEPLCDALQEQEVDEVPGLAISQFANVSGGFQPITQQACFGVWEVTATENNCTVRYDLRGLVAYIDGELDQPVVTIRNNSQTGVYPCDILFQIMVDRNGLLDTSGRPRLFGGRQGIIYELDPPNYFTDNGDLIPLNIVRDGYNGQEEGISGFEKVATKSRVRGTQNSEFAVVVTVFADGGSESDSDDLSLSANLGAWGDGGVWTDSKAVGQWNAASIQARRGNHGVHGKNFKMQVRDNGAINGDFELSELSIEGHTYERQ